MKINKVCLIFLTALLCGHAAGQDSAKVVAPHLLARITMPLPRSAWALKITGAVSYTFQVNKEGNVTEAELHGSSLLCPSEKVPFTCRQAFDAMYEAGLQAVRNMHFRTDFAFGGIQQFNIGFDDCHGQPAPDQSFPYLMHISHHVDSKRWLSGVMYVSMPGPCIVADSQAYAARIQQLRNHEIRH